MITAHSGSDGYADNSLEFIEMMVQSSVDAFEIDAQLSPTGEIYLAHDSLDDWSQAVSLADCYRILGRNPKMIVNVDCKQGEIGPLALQIALELGVKDQVVLSGALPLNLFNEEDYPHLFYNLENHFELESVTGESFIRGLVEISSVGIKVVQCYYGLANSDLIALLNRHGLKLSVWTVNEIDLIHEYLQMGCYNVTSRKAMEFLNSLN